MSERIDPGVPMIAARYQNENQFFTPKFMTRQAIC